MIWSILGIAAILLAVAGTSFLVGFGKGYDKARERYRTQAPIHAKREDRGGKAGQNYSKGFESADPELRESGPLVTDPNDRP